MNKMFVFVAVLLTTAGVFAQVDLMSKEYDFGISGCMWLGGDIEVGSYNYDKDASFMLRGFMDAYLMEKLAVGLFVNLAPVDQNGTELTFYEMGFSIKPRFMIDKDLAFKPGVNIGYRGCSSDNDFWSSMDGMALDISAEFQKALEKFTFLIDTGFLTQPVGGSYDLDIQWAPILYFGVGLVF